MKAEFTEIIKSEVEIDFQKVFNFIKSELETVYNKSVPFYYLVKTEQINKDMDANDNKSMFNSLVDKFFIFCMKCEPVSYYVIKGGDVLTTYDDKEMASMYAHKMDGYIMEVK